MSLKDFFIPVKSMSGQEARTFMNDHGEGTYTLLDVRQPGEYEQEHIPGARLVPLPSLPDRFGEIMKHEPVIVYCAVGGRSRVAAQMLAGAGFTNVYNLSGGIKGWNGPTTEGPPDLHLAFVQDISEPEQLIAFAWHMEEAQRTFYLKMQETVADPQAKELFAMLAGMEDLHKKRVLEVCELAGMDVMNVKNIDTELLEGGLHKEALLEHYREFLDSLGSIVQVAMMLEARSLDLYLRLSREVNNDSIVSFLVLLAGEEKKHLEQLGELLEKKR